jgi:DNA polymerase-3 subunit delta'
MEGVGKFTTAREWTKLLLCEKPAVESSSIGRFADSCGSCESCRLFEAGSHPDFAHVYKELLEFTKDGKDRAAPRDLAIDVIREFLVDKVSMRPTLSQRKVFVVSEAEKLNTPSQNCLLKVLEEPPRYCHIILLCTQLERLLPTIRSRCQIIRFGPIDQDRIIEAIAKMGLESRTAQYFARLAQGSIGQACQWARLELAGAKLYQAKTEIIDSLAGVSLAATLALAEKLLDKAKQTGSIWADLEKTTSKTDINRRAIKLIIHMLICAFRDVITLQLTPEKSLVNLDQRRQIEALCRRFDARRAAEAVSDCCQMLQWIDANVNERLIFEHLLLRLPVRDTMAA